MQVISLFSGIGGFELAAKWMGWDNIVSCEINDFGRKVLAYHFPDSYHHDDVKTLNYETIKQKSRYNPKTTTILVGGFPCQPFSVAGAQKGTDDNRHLWPEMYRVIQEIQPEYIVAENVRGILNIEGGMVFEQVCLDLENEGYEVQTFIIPACGKNAPHKRDRVWFVAYSNGINWRGEFSEHKKQERNILRKSAKNNGQYGTTTNPSILRQQEQGERIRQVHTKEGKKWKASWTYNDGRWPTKPPICGRDDGISRELAGITFPKWRKEALKAYGNAIVPQIAFEIFKTIDKLC